MNKFKIKKKQYYFIDLRNKILYIINNYFSLIALYETSNSRFRYFLH